MPRTEPAPSPADEEHRRRRVAKILDEAEIPELHLRHRPEIGSHPGWDAVRDRIIGEFIGASRLGVICGRWQNGKTSLAVEVIHAYAEQERTARYITAADLHCRLMLAIRDQKPNAETDLLARYIRRVQLLVIDEFEKVRETDYASTQLERILRERREWGNDTLIVSNLTPEKLVDRLGPAVAARIPKQFVYVCTWPAFGPPSLLGEQS
jgi:chromosomal replication initiation ATPase DnaA